MSKTSKALPFQYGIGGTYSHDLGAIAFGNPMDLVGKSDCERKRQKKIRDLQKELNLKPL
jgi:hypothetical protein